MNYTKLHENEIYPLPIEGYEQTFLVYAPLSGIFFRLGVDDVERLENVLSGNNPDDKEARELLDYVVAAISNKRLITSKRTTSELHKLTILPTYRCNFKCTYCFSAQGRSNHSLNREKALAAIDFFIDRKRTKLNDLWLAILGGGEPFLTPDLTAEIIEHARHRSKEQGFRLGIGLTTNGSLYNARLSKVMVQNCVNLGVSFEVLEDIQNRQRGNYGKVVSTVNRYLDEGVDLTVKSIITPLNVNQLEMMVHELHRIMPGVKKYKLQIVEDSAMFADLDTMRKFYDDFSRNFFGAQKIGFSFGMDVYVLASKMLDQLVEHYCGGEMCLNPAGGITVCHRYSSHSELGYDDFCYGHIDDNCIVHIDEEHFAQLMSHDIYHSPKCSHCFAKWHCGGGCLAQSTIYDNAHIDVICQWTRDFTYKILLQQLQNKIKDKN